MIASAAMADASELVDSIRLRDDTTQFLVTVTDGLNAARSAFKGRVDEFLYMPADPLMLETVLRRMENTVRLPCLQRPHHPERSHG